MVLRILEDCSLPCLHSYVRMPFSTLANTKTAGRLELSRMQRMQRMQRGELSEEWAIYGSSAKNWTRLRAG